MRTEFVARVLCNILCPHPEEPERSEGVSKDGRKQTLATPISERKS